MVRFIVVAFGCALGFAPTLDDGTISSPSSVALAYESLPSVHYHHILRSSEGVVVAFLDRSSASSEGVFSVAAQAFRCISRAYVFNIAEDDRARFIASSFSEEHQLPTKLTPPFAVHMAHGAPKHTSSSGSTAPWHEGDWSGVQLQAWVYALHQIEVLSDRMELDSFQQAHAAVAIAFVHEYCDQDASLFHEALRIGRNSTGSADLRAAVSTNLDLAAECFPQAVGTPEPALRIIAVLDYGRGVQLTYPDHLPTTAAAIGQWLGGLVLSRDTPAALHDEV